ncbi:MAG: Cas9 endonuclease PAM-interacting domain-containing protein [Lachnospiraceae bacterium]|nr:Cas9 endonuclease PAM-interacting domain-containing protein [Lachnospiraceae bacterium]
MKTKTLFEHEVSSGGQVVWNGEKSVAKVKDVLKTNHIHYTRFAFMRHGGFFAQNPLKAKEGLFPRKKGLDPNKYGGYSKTTAAAFLLVQYKEKGKKEAMIMPVELLYVNQVFSNEQIALGYAQTTLETIWNRNSDQIKDISFPLGLRPLKINTMFSFDGFRACLTGKASKGKQLGLTSMMPLIIGNYWEEYVKKLDSFLIKKEKNRKIVLNYAFDGISKKDNMQLYIILKDKIVKGPYEIPFATQKELIEDGEIIFGGLSEEEQVAVLSKLVLLLKSGRSGSCDLTAIKGSKMAGVYVIGSKLSGWKKNFKRVSIIDSSTSGIHETKSLNLMELV